MVILLGGALLVACGGEGGSTTQAGPVTTVPAPSTTTVPVEDDGFLLYESSSDDFRLLIPSDWTAISADDITSEEFTSTLTEEFGEGFTNQVVATLGESGKLFVVDLSGQDAFAANLNVIQSPFSGIPLDDYDEAMAGQLGMLGVDDLQATTTELPAGAAITGTYSVPAFDSRASVAVIFTPTNEEWTITISYGDMTDLGFDPIQVFESFELAN